MNAWIVVRFVTANMQPGFWQTAIAIVAWTIAALYILHLLDPVHGAAHFDVSEERAKAIVTEMMAVSPGYLIPKLVREIAGEPSKTRIC